MTTWFLMNVCYLAKLWKKTEGHRNHQAKDNGSTDVPNRSDYHWVPLDKLCPETLTADFTSSHYQNV